MESTSRGISLIWELKSERFGFQGDHIPSEFGYNKVLLEKDAPMQIQGLTQDRKDIMAYTDEMASIMTGYNYETAAESPPSRKINVDKLSFEFKFPEAIESKVKEIFAEE